MAPKLKTKMLNNDMKQQQQQQQQKQQQQHDNINETTMTTRMPEVILRLASRGPTH
jgi:hypothetical protein